MTEDKTFSQLVDGSVEDFKAYCADKDLGYVMSLHNQIVSSYSSAVAIKNKLLELVKQKGEDSEEANTLKGVYAVLLRLEHKAMACVEIERERSATVL